MKKLVSLLLALALCTAMIVSASAETTYTKMYALEDLSGNTMHNGFVTAIGMTADFSLTLNDDGTYAYTKHLVQPTEDGVVLTYTFTGTYTQDGNTVVLAFPTECVWLENWASLADGGYFLNGNGTAQWVDGKAEGDMVKCKEEDGHVPFDLFPGAYMVDTLVTSEDGFDAAACTVTVVLNGDSFDYVIMNSDDD